MPLTVDRDGEVWVKLGHSFRQRSHENIEEQIREVLGLPGATTATTLAISHLEIATEMMLHFVQSQKWKSISVAFQWWEPQEAGPDPSLRDFLEVATRQTASLTVKFLSIPHMIHAIGRVLQEEGTNIQELQFSHCRFRREEAIAFSSGLRSNPFASWNWGSANSKRILCSSLRRH